VGLFVVQRTLQSVITVFVVTIVVFLFMHLAGDPAALLISEEATKADLAAMRVRLGLDRPLYEQYTTFMVNFWRGDDSIKSFRYSLPVLPLVAEGLKLTGVLAVASLFISIVLAIPLGTIAALRRGSFIDVGLRLVAVLGQSMPSFWVAMLLMLVFAVKLKVLPVSGLGLENAILPVATLSFFQIAVLMRLYRSELLDALHEDYVRTARAKGLAETVVMYRHIFKNAVLPVVTMTGLQLSNLILGAVVVEPIFAWPGLGYLMVNSVFQLDYPVVLGGVILAGTLVTFVNLLVDILYGALDPRIRLS
jgi:peptide/nickel transport system permease protein